MRLRRIQLHNFRTFADLDVDLDATTVIVGPNDSGKSTLVDAIAALLEPVGRPVQDPIQRASVLRRRRQDDFVSPWEWAQAFSPWDDEYVTVIGTFSELTQLEVAAWREDARSGELVVGIFFQPDEESRQGPYLIRNREAHREHWGRAVENAPNDGHLWVDVAMNLTRVNEGVAERPRRLPSLVRIYGPEHGPTDISEIVAPALGSAISKMVAELPEAVRDSLVDAIYAVPRTLSRATSEALPSYFANSTGVYFHLPESRRTVEPVGVDLPSEILVEAISSVLLPLQVNINRRYGRRDDRDHGDGDDEDQEFDFWAKSEPMGVIGAGARRAISIAALEVYASAEIWPEDRSMFLAIEEPEVGLHPGAVRRVAASLHRLVRRSNISALVVTHAPSIINATSPSSVRLLRPEFMSPRLVLPQSLTEVTEHLGATTADLLLAERFLVVEGASDKVVLVAWASRVSIDLESAGVKLVPAGGWTKAETVARLLELAFPSARVYVALDAGEEIKPELAAIAKRRDGRVKTFQWRYREIEGFFTTNAVRAWLELSGAGPGGDVDMEPHRLGKPKDYLHALAHKYLDRRYQVEEDGRRIALLTSSDEVDAEVLDFLRQVASGPPEDARDAG